MKKMSHFTTSLSWFTIKQFQFKYKYSPYCFIYRTLNKMSRSAIRACVRACARNNSEGLPKFKGNLRRRDEEIWGDPHPGLCCPPPSATRSTASPPVTVQTTLDTTAALRRPCGEQRAPTGASTDGAGAMVVVSKRNGTERGELTVRHE